MRAWRLLLLVILISCCGPRLRILRVEIAGDEAFRAHPDWQEIARRRLAAASEIYRTQFHVSWEVVAYRHVWGSTPIIFGQASVRQKTNNDEETISGQE